MIPCSKDPEWISHHALKGKEGDLHWNPMEKQIYCCDISTMWAGGTTLGMAGGLTQTLIICMVMHVVAQRLRSRSMDLSQLLGWKSRCLELCHHTLSLRWELPQATVLVSWTSGFPRYWESSEEGQRLGGKNYLESQTSYFTQSLQTNWHMTSKTEAHTRYGPTSLLWGRTRCNEAEECNKSCFHPHT